MIQMIKGLKVKLKVNNKENTKLFGSAGVSRWAYNYALSRTEEYFKETGKFLGDREIRKEITKLKQTEKYSWLYDYSNNITKQAVKDACTAFSNFFKELKKRKKELLDVVKKKLAQGKMKVEDITIKDYKHYPRFKSKKKSDPKFYQDTEKIKFKDGKVRIEKVGWIRLTEKNRIPENAKYINPRVSYDGQDWFVSVGVEFENDNSNTQYSNGIGIDVGIKDIAITSDGKKFKNINKDKKIRDYRKLMKRLQRKVSRQYEMNKIKMKGGERRYQKTNNIIKTENKIRKLHIRLTNIRTDYIHKITTNLVKTKPQFVAMEDLNIKGMMKNKHLSKSIQEQKLYEFKRQLEYKCDWNEIKLIEVDRWFPSSKTCNACGNIKDDLKLSDRTYICDCGYSEDRDINAALNLRDYGKSLTA